MDRAAVLSAVCEFVARDEVKEANAHLRREYPFAPVDPAERKYTDLEALRVFVRDGFVDRYSGARLVFPGVLRLLSLRLPETFPFHPNWKMNESHIAYWELSPTVDHVVPVALGGQDDEQNWVTTSMLRNSAKANWTLEELGWAVHPPGRFEDWDGLLGWFVEYMKVHPDMLTNTLLGPWHRAATALKAPRG